MTTDPRSLNWEPYAVPLDVAQERIANWIDLDQGTPVDPADMRAFVVRREDFVELLRQHDTEFLRLYVGRKKQKDELAGDQLSPCLLLVSAAYRGDVYPDAPEPDTIIDLVGDMPTGAGNDGVSKPYEVFDFSQICPPVCDEGSPLYIGPPDASCC